MASEQEERSSIPQKSDEMHPKDRDVCSSEEPHLVSDQDQDIKDNEVGRVDLPHSDNNGIRICQTLFSIPL